MVISDVQNLFSLDMGEIYWSDMEFYQSKRFMSLKMRVERIRRIKLLYNVFFKELNSLSREKYIIPYYNFESNEYTWFYNWKDLRGSIFYKDIIKEANKKDIMLKYTTSVSYQDNICLASKLFMGNMNYISSAYFVIPELNIIYYPTKNISLKLFGEIKSQQNINSIGNILSHLIKGKLWIKDT